MVTTAQIAGYIAQSQRAMASYMVSAVRKEAQGEDCNYLYNKSRYLSAAIRNLSWTEHGMTNAEIESIIHCMIECGDISDFSSSPITFPQITVINNNPLSVRITDLIDGPMGSLSGVGGYLLRVNALGTAWEWVLASSIAGTVTINNTVFVSKNGSDTTGLVQRLDKPFLTFAAARTALMAAFTPSTTNRILIKVFPGYYTEGIILANCVDYDLTNCVIARTSGNFGTIDDSGVNCNSIIYGEPEIIRSGTGSPANAIYLSGGSTLNGRFRKLSSSVGETVYLAIGSANIWGDVVNTSASGYAAIISDNSANVFNYYGNVTSSTIDGIFCGDGILNIYGNIVATVGAGVTMNASAILNMYGNITAGGYAISGGSGAECNITNAVLISTTTKAVYAQTAITILRNCRIITTAANMSALIKLSANPLILDNCTFIGTGTGYSVTSDAARTIKVYGACQGNKAIDVTFAITQQVNSIVVDSNVT